MTHLRLLFYILVLSSLKSFSYEVTLQWQQVITELNEDLEPESKIYFSGALYSDSISNIPFFSKYINIKSKNLTPKVNILNYETIPLNNEELKLVKGFSNNSFTLSANIVSSASDNFVRVCGYPIFNKDGSWVKVTSFSYEVSYISNNTLKQARSINSKSALTSPLANGDWYKIGVVKDGMYALTYSNLSSLGINVNSLNPNNIVIYGNGLGRLPESNSDDYTKTLTEVAIDVKGSSDGSFDEQDLVVFYAKGPHDLSYSKTNDFVNYVINNYADTAYYFLSISSSTGKRVSSLPTLVENNSTDYYYQIDHYEKDNTNLIQSGQKWYGDFFDITTSRNYSFNLGSPVSGKPTKFAVDLVARSFVSSNNRFDFKINGQDIGSTGNIPSVSGSYTNIYARQSLFLKEQQLTSGSVTLNLRYNKPQTSSVAWLDYITINHPTKLIFNTSPLTIINPDTYTGVPGTVTKFNVVSSANIFVWDVTNPINPVNIPVSNASGVSSFVQSTDTVRFFALHNGANYFSPISYIKIQNQNILSLTDKTYYIICPKGFNSEAQRLAKFHQDFHNYETAIVNLDDIYNEFSSGKQDPTAIRNFVKYLYNNASSNDTRIKYLMLLGDASYDYKNILKENTNVLPIYQSIESLDPLATFASDDYYGIIEDDETVYGSTGTLDIGIGRFPGNTVNEIAGFVNKVINYNNTPINNNTNGVVTPKTNQNWKNNVTYVVDDGNTEDGFTNSHFIQTEFLVDNLLLVDSNYNVKKIYFENYLKEGTVNGGKYPSVNRDINNSIEQGTFFISYIGHGGEAGWADEKVLEVSDILKWDNNFKLPLFLTATCEFSRFDNPDRVSAGEQVILNQSGGAIAMLTTVRLVFGGFSNNIGFTKNFIDETVKRDNGINATLGDAFRLAKLQSSMGTKFNKRKFALLGDPGMRLSFPENKINILDVLDENNNPIDTINALSKVKIRGEVRGYDNSLLSNYNGLIYPTIFDKPQINFTRDNNNKSRIDSFYTQQNILFKGIATVTNGVFEYEFIVPKDINYQFGKGKISHYSSSKDTDANGYNNDFIIGGSNPNAPKDETPPGIKLFFNDTLFINGGLTNETPLLIAHISDESGINITGNGIGRNIVATIDGDQSKSIELNEFFTSDLNSYQSGKLQYKLTELPEGEHQLTLKAWDIYNNSSEESITFVVSKSNNLTLEHVLNYPNPFTTSTSFMFEHNQPSEELLVQITIFTITGKVVKTIQTTISGNRSFVNNKIDWDGLDDFGDQLGRGVYVYKLQVRTSSGLEAEKIEKIVLLR